MFCSTLYLFAIISLGKRRLPKPSFIFVFSMSGCCYRSLTLSHGAMDWSITVIVAFPNHTIFLLGQIKNTSV